MFKTLREDIKTALERDPAARNWLEVSLLYPGMHAIWIHRIAHFLWKRQARFLARTVSFFARAITGIEIHPGAKIGKRFFIDHGAGVVIGETAEIGNDVTIYQGVVLGGVSLKREKRHPTLRNKVVVGAGAIILGPVEIGEGSKIGAGSVVVTNIPPFTTAVGIPAKPAGRHTLSDNVDLNHHLVPDPIKRALEHLTKRIEDLEGKISSITDSPPNRELTAMGRKKTDRIQMRA